MIIGYRRIGSSLGITEKENYKIGGWHEKRLAFVQSLRERGHEVLWCSKPTVASRGLWDYKRNLERKLDLLFIEIGQQNIFFPSPRDYIIESFEILNSAGCPIVFLLDDPDLLIKMGNKNGNPQVASLEFKIDSAEIWANCELNEMIENDLVNGFIYKHKEDLHIPKFKVRKFPVSGLLKYPEMSNASVVNRGVYLGGVDNGREKILAMLRGEDCVEIINEKSFYPTQPERKNFYGKYAANLGIVGVKHKRLRWYTGRIFHALSAGTVSLVEHNNFLASYFPVLNELEIKEQINDFFIDADYRESLFQKAMKIIPEFKSQLNELYEQRGL